MKYCNMTCQTSGRGKIKKINNCSRLFSVMLMYGSAKNSRWLILPWLVATFLFILAYVAGMILSTHLFGVTLLSIAFLTIAIIEVGTD